jgi:2-keto-4-pentenoate hydratase
VSTDPALDVVAEAAQALRAAEADATSIPPLVETYPALDLDTAYAIQLLNIGRRLDAGGQVRGHKVGLTSKAMQEMLGVDQPDYGHLLDDMFHQSGDRIAAARYVAPRVEPEVAFVLGAPLRGPGCDADAVRAATRAVVPAIELIDSRIEGWRIGLLDTIADNASSAGVILGAEVPLDGRDVTAITVELRVDGEVATEGRADAVLGDPANAVAWLVNTLHERGITLEAGHVVMPGSCTKAVDVAPGTAVEAVFADLGTVEVAFT